ncbi:hypothetical protein RDI58_024822 [Solanum bulbocastanum]|uniref:Uncharacterized protein n=1 Tax=Solanum bulbocastanum TaxID=147425 RepID=A0AAN8Y3P5_SOLBU
MKDLLVDLMLHYGGKWDYKTTTSI